MSEQEIVKNTLLDIWGEPLKTHFIGDDGKLGPEMLMDMTPIVESISTPIWGDYTHIKGLDGELILGVYRLNDYLAQVPHGIIDKKRPGIGATTLEINSKRNSIIVMPTKILAHDKFLQHGHTCYVGSEFKGQLNSTKGGKKEIIDYLSHYQNSNKKFLVVADSLKRLIEILEVEEVDIFNNYFLMVDEVDLMQSDSTFRPSLEDVMDYYFRFNVKKRALITATMKEFSNPRLKYECRFDLTDFNAKRKFDVVHTDNIQLFVKSYIEAKADQKILIAYNSILKIKGIIYSLPEELQHECRILCSDASVTEAGTFYSKLTNKNKLPGRINFMTCSYFAGIDINERYHLLSASDATRFFQILSIDKMTQIAGRCRDKEGLFSETVIFNTPKKSNKHSKGDHTENILGIANKILSIYEHMDSMSSQDEELIRIFDVVKTAIKSKASYEVMGEKIELTRLNIDGVMVPAYFNIDAVLERIELDTGFYSKPYMLPKELKNTHDITFKSIKYGTEDEDLETARNKSREEQVQLYDSYLLETINRLKALIAEDNVDKDSLKKLRRELKRNSQTLIDRFEQLYQYVDSDTLLDLLWDIRKENKKAFRGINNAVILWALDNEHPFLIHLRHNFREGEMYSAKQIHELLIPAMQYHIFKYIRPRSAVSLLKAYFKVERPRSKYRIIGTNPYEFKQKNKIIGKDENLNVYLKINSQLPIEKVVEVIATL